MSVSSHGCSGDVPKGGKDFGVVCYDESVLYASDMVVKEIGGILRMYEWYLYKLDDCGCFTNTN